MSLQVFFGKLLNNKSVLKHFLCFSNGIFTGMPTVSCVFTCTISSPGDSCAEVADVLVTEGDQCGPWGRVGGGPDPHGSGALRLHGRVVVRTVPGR